MERLSEISQTFVVYCQSKFSSKNSLVTDLNKKFTYSRTPLHIAAITSDVKLAKQILYQKPDLANQQDSNGFTPLHLASARTSLEMVRLLLKKNPDARQVPNKDGKTPLYVAAMNDRVEIMKLLIESERLEALLPSGETILHFYVKNNCSVGALDVLVQKLANHPQPSDLSTIINTVDKDGNTVLHVAAEMCKFEIVSYLLQQHINIDLDAENKKGLKALNGLSQAQREDLELGFNVYSGDTKEITDETSSENKDHHKQVMNKKSPKKRNHKERMNVLLVVSTLIAAIAFQAMSNPAGGVWQEDSKVDSSTSDMRTTPARWEGYSTTHGNVSYSLNNTNKPDSTVEGLNLEDHTGATVSDYDTSDDENARSAGDSVMAFYYPDAYKVYVLVNTIAFSLSLTVVFAVICGFVHEKSVAQNRILLMLMCISIGCISVSYFVVTEILTPSSFTKDQGLYSVSIYFGLCCTCGITLFLWRLISRMVKLQKKHLTAFNYLKELFTMDAKAAGKVALLIIGLCAFYWTRTVLFIQVEAE